MARTTATARSAASSSRQTHSPEPDTRKRATMLPLLLGSIMLPVFPTFPRTRTIPEQDILSLRRILAAIREQNN